MTNNKVTMETLQKYLDLQQEIRAIEAEIQALYYPVKTVPIGGFGHSTSPGDPTAAAVSMIMRQKDRLAAKKAEYEQITNQIENWVDNLPDHKVAAIVRWHYLNAQPKSWAETCRIMFGYSDKDVCRRIVKNYLEGTESETD